MSPDNSASEELTTAWTTGFWSLAGHNLVRYDDQPAFIQWVTTSVSPSIKFSGSYPNILQRGEHEASEG
jgi:hypothetical protein